MTRREGGGFGVELVSFFVFSFVSCRVVLCLCVYSGDSIELKGIWKRNGRSRKTVNGQFRYEGKALGLQPK